MIRFSLQSNSLQTTSDKVHKQTVYNRIFHNMTYYHSISIKVTVMYLVGFSLVKLCTVAITIDILDYLCNNIECHVHSLLTCTLYSQCYYLACSCVLSHDFIWLGFINYVLLLLFSWYTTIGVPKRKSVQDRFSTSDSLYILVSWLLCVADKTIVLSLSSFIPRPNCLLIYISSWGQD